MTRDQPAMPFALAGKTALVTGAASGIGREIALLFHSLGAKVIATDRDLAGLEALAGQAGPGILTLEHDVAEAADWDRALARVDKAFGRLDVLVNNAGIMLSRPFADAGIEVLRQQLRVNVESVYLGIHGALPLLDAAVASGAASASVINIASIYGKVGGAQYAAYSASKGAVRALGKAVAIELAPHRIRVNSVLPGPVATNLSAGWDPPRDAAGNLLSAEQALAAWARLIPLGRLGDTRDIAPLAAFLASDLAGFVTGAEFVADGGYTAA